MTNLPACQLFLSATTQGDISPLLQELQIRKNLSNEQNINTIKETAREVLGIDPEGIQPQQLREICNRVITKNKEKGLSVFFKRIFHIDRPISSSLKDQINLLSHSIYGEKNLTTLELETFYFDLLEEVTDRDNLLTESDLDTVYDRLRSIETNELPSEPPKIPLKLRIASVFSRSMKEKLNAIKSSAASVDQNLVSWWKENSDKIRNEISDRSQNREPSSSLNIHQRLSSRDKPPRNFLERAWHSANIKFSSQPIHSFQREIAAELSDLNPPERQPNSFRVPTIDNGFEEKVVPGFDNEIANITSRFMHNQNDFTAQIYFINDVIKLAARAFSKDIEDLSPHEKDSLFTAVMEKNLKNPAFIVKLMGAKFEERGFAGHYDSQTRHIDYIILAESLARSH